MRGGFALSRLLRPGLDLADRIDHRVEGQHGRGMAGLVVAHRLEHRDIGPAATVGRAGVLLEHAANGLPHLAQLPKDREIIFFCNCPNEASAASAAKVLMDLGYTREQVGKIDINEFATYVAVARDIGGEAVARLNEGRIKGRSVKARMLKD